MKATELMIGDWVMWRSFEFTEPKQIGGTNDKMVRFSGCSFWEVIDAIQPIPLTAEILEKNFPKPRGEYWVEGDFPVIGYSIPCITDGHRPYVEVSIYDPACVMEFEMFFHYVHELQHALKLCKIEKEIVL